MTIDLEITLSSDVARSPRVQQLEGIFDVPPAEQSTRFWRHRFDLPSNWQIGVIVGPSGAGKSTLARRAFGDAMAGDFAWSADRSILDGFPADLGILEITGLLSSVGFSSPPAWVRAYHQLSTGEQFRVNVARALAEKRALCVIDEFTSVVDRVIARIGSAAVASCVRRRSGKFVAVTCHYDVIDWLDPDWVYEPHTQILTLRENRVQTAEVDNDAAAARGCLRLGQSTLSGELVEPGRRVRRPPIHIDITRCGTGTWALFKPHHYLSGDLHRAAKCFLATVWGRPAAFIAVLPFPHPTSPSWREHRLVCLPDFQGVGIGNACSEHVAALFSSCRKKYSSVWSHPAIIAHRRKSPLWKMTRATSLMRGGASRRMQKFRRTQSTCRLTASFVYRGPQLPEEAKKHGLPVKQKRLLPQVSPTLLIAAETSNLVLTETNSPHAFGSSRNSA